MRLHTKETPHVPGGFLVVRDSSQSAKGYSFAVSPEPSLASSPAGFLPSRPASGNCPKLVYYCPSSSGGIVDYAYTHAAALAEAGVEVTLLTAGVQVMQSAGISWVRSLKDESRPIDAGSRIVRRILRLGLIHGNILSLKAYIRENRIRNVMLASYSEYAAPLWSYPLRSLARSGVRFSAMLHDPVRDYVVGPKWWHRRSIRSGYSFLSQAFVHEE